MWWPAEFHGVCTIFSCVAYSFPVRFTSSLRTIHCTFRFGKWGEDQWNSDKKRDKQCLFASKRWIVLWFWCWELWKVMSLVERKRGRKNIGLREKEKHKEGQDVAASKLTLSELTADLMMQEMPKCLFLLKAYHVNIFCQCFSQSLSPSFSQTLLL